MTSRKTTGWTLEFDRLEVVAVRKLAEAARSPTREALASVTFSNPTLSLDLSGRNGLRALVQNGPTESTDIRYKIWEALA